jgi:hypothetical protein
VECKGTWNQESVFKNETHSHKQGKMQEIEPNDFQVHFHFESCIHAKVPNTQSLGWKGKQMQIWAPKISLEFFLSVDA